MDDGSMRQEHRTSFVVMPGLDPGIHRILVIPAGKSGLPGRPAITTTGGVA
jgi:hypothetical protein